MICEMIVSQKYIKQDLDINNNCFDIIRIVAAFTVFLGHFITHFNVSSPILFDVAYFVRGVPVFFMLSGFFIAASLERYSVKEFLIRRFVRIYPALWVCIIFNSIIIFGLYALPSIKELCIYIVTQFTICQFYTGDWLRGYGVGTPNGALWMISCMIQFYILSIFISKWMKSQSVKIWIWVISIFAVISWGSIRFQHLVPEIIWKLYAVEIIPFLYIFLFGMMLYYYRSQLIPVLAKYWYLFCLAYFVWEAFIPSSVTVFFEGVLYNIVTTVLLMLMIGSIGFAFGKYRFKADYSYSFYLYHMVVINIVYHLFLQEFLSLGQFVVTLIVTIIVIAILTYLSYQFVECKLGDFLQKKLLQ